MTTRTRSDADRTTRTRAAPDASDGRALTFVFTDIEGSTRLLEQLRDRYAELALHGPLIGEAAQRAGGELVDTQGDSFFLVFPTADQAVALAPVQFLADHLEILYDVDVAAREQAEQHGLRFVRVRSLNADQQFISALADVATAHAGGAPAVSVA